MIEPAVNTDVHIEGCPFCREDPYIHRPSFQGDHWQIGCDCGHGEDSDHGAVWMNGATLEEAAGRWNRRGATLTTTERRAAVRGLIMAALRGSKGGSDEFIDRLAEVIVP